MKTLLGPVAVFIAMLIAPISAAASEEPQTYVAIEHFYSMDRCQRTVVITASSEIAAALKPNLKKMSVDRWIVNKMFTNTHLLDAEAYAKVHYFFVREAAKRNGKASPAEFDYVISGRLRSGDVNGVDDAEMFPSGDRINFHMDLSYAESRDMLEAFVKYLSEQGIDADLQKQLADWR